MALSRVEVMPAANGDQPFAIGDSSLGRGVGCRMLEEGAPSFDAIVQTQPYFESDAPENLDRYNDTTDWSVTAVYTLATFEEARIFARELQKRVPRVGTVRYTFDQMVCYLVDAKLRPITLVRDEGCTLIYRFNISGGLLLDSLPAEEPTGGEVPT